MSDADSSWNRDKELAAVMSHSRQRKAQALIRSAYETGKKSLLEYQAEQVAARYGIRVPDSGLAQSIRRAELLAKRIGFPLAMKIVSEDIPHKTDVGGVFTGIDSLRKVRETYSAIVQNAKKVNRMADINGVLIQKMAPKGCEFVVGATRDSQFGPTVMFGLGGVYVELFNDVTFRLAPVTKAEALAMTKEIKSSPLLSGFRGSAPLDRVAAARTIVAVGELIHDEPKIESVDLNPLVVYPKGAMAVDVRITLQKKGRIGKTSAAELSA